MCLIPLKRLINLLVFHVYLKGKKKVTLTYRERMLQCSILLDLCSLSLWKDFVPLKYDLYNFILYSHLLLPFSGLSNSGSITFLVRKEIQLLLAQMSLTLVLPVPYSHRFWQNLCFGPTLIVNATWHQAAIFEPSLLLTWEDLSASV